MTGIKIPVALFLSHLVLVPAIFIPQPPSVLSSNNTFPTDLVPSNISNLNAPNPPRGFHIDLNFNESVQLAPLEVFINAIELMSLFTELDFMDTKITLPMSMTNIDFRTLCSIEPLPPRLLVLSRLRVQYAVLALYRAGMAIAAGNKFYKLQASIWMEQDNVGLLECRPKAQYDTYVDNGSVYLEANSSNGLVMAADRGSIVDPDNPSFKIDYVWDNEKLKAPDVFSSFLDALAIAAEYKDNDVVSEVPAAYSASKDVVFTIWTKGKNLTWAQIKRALLLIWQKIVIEHQRPRFEGFEFGLEFGGEKIGGGRLLKWPSAIFR